MWLLGGWQEHWIVTERLNANAEDAAIDLFLAYKPVVYRCKKASVKKVLEAGPGRRAGANDSFKWLVVSVSCYDWIDRQCRHSMSMTMTMTMTDYRPNGLRRTTQKTISLSLSFSQAQKYSEAKTKAANIAIINQLKQFTTQTKQSFREAPVATCLTQAIQCDNECKVLLSLDALLAERIEANGVLDRSRAKLRNIQMNLVRFQFRCDDDFINLIYIMHSGIVQVRSSAGVWVRRSSRPVVVVPVPLSQSPSRHTLSALIMDLLIVDYQENGYNARSCNFVWGPEHFKLFLSDKLDKSEKARSDKDKDIQSSWAKYEGAVFFSVRHGSSDTVVSNGAIGQIQYQCEGTRLVAVLSLTEAVQRLHDDVQAGQLHSNSNWDSLIKFIDWRTMTHWLSDSVAPRRTD